MNQEEKNKAISGIITALCLALVVVICLAFGYDPPDPPIPEEGVEVNLGNSDFGLGNNPMPDASEASSAPRPRAATENVSTQRTESTTPINTSDNPSTAKHDNPTPTTTKPDPPKEPEINKNALFNGNRYDGTPGNGGVGFSLAGRSAKALPSPNTSTQKQGKVVVKIWVDRAGNVTQTSAPEKGSTVTDAALVRQAKAAALKAKFSPKDDAPEVQTGTITYVFRTN